MEANSLFAQLWKERATEWEGQRYKSQISNLIYSSLYYRMEYLVFILEQAAPNTRVVEIGCGSGLLFGKLKNKSNLKYIGYDISATAIQDAKEKWSTYENAEWHCVNVDDLSEISCDILISAGLLDWLNDEQIFKMVKTVKCTHFIHSFSHKKRGIKTSAHKLFTFYQSWSKKANYSPRKFIFSQIENFFGTGVKFICNPELSFGCFVHNLSSDFLTDYKVFKTNRYFLSKSDRSGVVEDFIKNREFSALKKLLQNLGAQKVLEVGSGTGFYSKWLVESGAQLTSIDGFVNTENFFQNPNLKFINLNLENTNLNEQFNAICVFGVLEFVEDPERFVTYLARYSKLHTRVILLYPFKNGLAEIIYSVFHKIKGNKIQILSESKLVGIFSGADFTVKTKQKAGPLNSLIVFEKMR